MKEIDEGRYRLRLFDSLDEFISVEEPHAEVNGENVRILEMDNPTGQALWGDTVESDDGTVTICLALATDNGVESHVLFETIGHEIGHFWRPPDFPHDEEDIDSMEAYADHYENFTRDVYALYEPARREFPYPRGDKRPWQWCVEDLLKEMNDECPTARPFLIVMAHCVREVMKVMGSRLPMDFGNER